MHGLLSILMNLIITPVVHRLPDVMAGLLAQPVPGELRVCTMKPAVFQSCNPWNSV